MQNWICAYCQKLYLNPEALIEHIYKEHQQDMSDYTALALIAIKLLFIDSIIEEAMPINETEDVTRYITQSFKKN